MNYVGWVFLENELRGSHLAFEGLHQKRFVNGLCAARLSMKLMVVPRSHCPHVAHISRFATYVRGPRNLRWTTFSWTVDFDTS